ncbi:MAG: GTPase Era [Ignavibacteria bacterium]|jgi:GTP-binding protein Era|nr:GTPase Era [Ignavibacteria bacterium]MDH7528669.1 GTPase Era [Ignavibacteria bacterium]
MNTDNLNQNYKAGYVTIFGEPNVGKSTLMNAVLNTKLSITTPKPQTTRRKILGIYSDNEAQIVFLDTPGLIEPKYLLQQKMVEAIHNALDECDLILAVVDVTEKVLKNFENKLIPLLIPFSGKKNIFLVINKIDLITKEEVLQIIDSMKDKFKFDEIVPVSALHQFNVQELTNTIKKYLPVHPPYFPTDILSQEPERFFIAEIIREKIFETYRDEVPYSTEVIVVEYKERPKGKDYINAEIYVERESQKKIIIGKDGEALKRIGQKARKDIENFLGKEVYLELYVKVRENWRDNPRWIKTFGY